MTKTTQLTDNQLGQLYAHMVNHYKAVDFGSGEQEKFKLLEAAFYNSIIEANGFLHHIFGNKDLETEAIAAFRYFYEIISKAPILVVHQIMIVPTKVIVTTDRCHYRWSNSGFSSLNWFLFGSLSASWGNSSGSSWTSSSNSVSGKSAGEAILFILLMIFLASVAAVTVLSLYYILTQATDDLSRFYYNEGWMKAATSLSSMLAGGAVVGLIGHLFLAGPLSSVMLAAGIAHPAGLVIATIVCLSIIAAAVAGYAVNSIKDVNNDALDPKDPQRYPPFTKQEREAFAKQGIPVIRARCARVVLRSEMSVPGREKSAHQDIRDLRRGKTRGFFHRLKLSSPVMDANAPPAYTPSA